jgi:hypothetical protein
MGFVWANEEWTMKDPSSCPLTGKRAFATMAGASAAFLLAGSAEAAIQTQAVNVTLTGDADGEIFLIYMTAGGDVTHGTFNSTTAVPTAHFAGGNLAAALAAGTSFFPVGEALVLYGNFMVGSSIIASRLAAGHMVGTSALFSLTTGFALLTHSTATTSTWLSGTAPPVSGYVGFVLANAAWSVGDPSFAWAVVTIDATNQMTVTGYGWETTPLIPTPAGGVGGGPGGGPGGASGTPEPVASGLGLLALGAAGVMRHKRRRRGLDVG